MKLNKQTITRARNAFKKVERIKKELAAKRDELRAAVNDVEEILGSYEDAASDLNVGLQYLNSAVDRASQFV